MSCLVEVRPSKVHGNGVFAKVDIPCGYVICYYDGDFVKKDNVKDWTYALSLGIGDFVRIGYKIPLNPEV